MGPLGRLAEQWSADQGFTVREAEPGLTIEEWDGLQLRPAVDIRMDEASLALFSSSLDIADLSQVWPGKPQEWLVGAVLWTRLEELLSMDPRPRALALADGEMTEVPSDRV